MTYHCNPKNFKYMTTAVAITRGAKITPRKVRLVADVIRNMDVKSALEKLKFVEKHAAGILIKTIKSAIANAVNTKKISEDSLKIKNLNITEGQFLKRFRAGSRGRTSPFKKRTSHITVLLEGN